MADAISLAEQIAEVKRELSLRAFVYPKLIASGKLAQRDAVQRELRLNAVLETLLDLQRKERLL